MVLPILKEILQLGRPASDLWTFAAVGIGVGSLTAGRLSGDKIESAWYLSVRLAWGIFSNAVSLRLRFFGRSVLVLMGFAADSLRSVECPVATSQRTRGQRPAHRDKQRVQYPRRSVTSAMLWGWPA
jgi:hypothetical protein